MFFGVAGVLSRVSGLITFPILSRAMPVAEFGALDYLMTLSNLIAVFAIFGLESAAVRFFFASDRSEDRFRELSRVLSLQMRPVLLLVVSSIAAFSLAARDDLNVQMLAIGLVLAQSALMVPIAHFQYIMIWREQRRDYLFSTVGQTILTVLVLIWACYGRSPSAVEVLTFLMVIRVVTFLHGYWATRRQFRLTLRPRGVSPILRYALPIGVVGTLAAFLPLIERQSILSFLTDADLGIYAAAARLGTLMTLPIAAFQLVWVPFALSHHRDPAAAVTYKAVLKLFTIASLATALALAACAEPLLRILTTPEYAGARVAVFPICLALVVKAIGDVVQVGIDISRKSHLKLYAFAATTAASLVAAPLLTYSLGIVGAAWAAVLAYSVKAVLEYRLAQSAHRMEWEAGRVLAITLIAGAVGLMAQFAGETHAGVAALTLLLGCVLIALVGYRLTLDDEERAQLWSLVGFGKTADREKQA